MVLPSSQRPRDGHRLPAHAQRPRHRRRRHRARPDGRRGPRRRHPLRQRRAHGQPRHRDRRAEHVLARHRPSARLPQPRRDPRGLRTRDPHERARPSSLRRRPRLHGLLGLPPGRHQERHGPPREDGARRPLGRPLPHHRPEGHRPLLRGHHPHQLAERQGRRRLRARPRVRLRPPEADAPGGRQPHRQTRRPAQQGALARRDPRLLPQALRQRRPPPRARRVQLQARQQGSRALPGRGPSRR